MALIQFTKNHRDHSTDRGYQFEFFCDRCQNGFMSEFRASTAGMAVTALRAAGNIFGGVLRQASSSTFEIERTIQGPLHDKAFRDAVEEATPNFRKCPKCTHWVCISSCWNVQRSLCMNCAPDLATELASAQAQDTVIQMRQKLMQQDLTKGMDLTAESIALCLGCGAQTHGAKFCPNCGKPTHAASECGKCAAKYEPGTKFCPECGNKVG